jgi:AraC-like DNA-binding protein
MDPLSDVLSLLKPRSYMFRLMDAGGAWSIQFPQHDGVKCYAIVSGQCWLTVEGVAEPVRLGTGDCFLLPRGRPFGLASDPDMTPVDAKTLFSTAANDAIMTINGGGDCLGVGGYFGFAGHHAEVLLGVLPPIVHIRKEAEKAALRWSMERIAYELRDPQPGGHLLAQHLAHMMLVQALRAHLAEGPSAGVGWLFALADRRMSAAITAMHDDPARRWTLQALAGRAGMSRSTFALKFKEAVGATPMDYLTRWRMLVAGDRLAHSSDPVSVIALSLGYESESAFSTAFKRVMGRSPRQYSRGRTARPPAYGAEETAAGADRLEPVAA